MKTPTETAEELIEKFKQFAHSNYHVDTGLMDLESEMVNATRCSIIHVEGIIESVPMSPSYESEDGMVKMHAEDFWSDVLTVLKNK